MKLHSAAQAIRRWRDLRLVTGSTRTLSESIDNYTRASKALGWACAIALVLICSVR